MDAYNKAYKINKKRIDMYTESLRRKFYKVKSQAREGSKILLGNEFDKILVDETISGVWCFGFDSATNFFSFEYSEIFFLVNFKLKQDPIFKDRDTVEFIGYPLRSFASSVISNGKTGIEKCKEKTFKSFKIMTTEELDRLRAMNAGSPKDFTVKSEELEFKGPVIATYYEELIFMTGESFNGTKRSTPFGIDIRKISRQIVSEIPNTKYIDRTFSPREYFNRNGVAVPNFLKDRQRAVLSEILEDPNYARSFVPEDIKVLSYKCEKHIDKLFFKARGTEFIFSHVQLMNRIEDEYSVAVFKNKKMYVAIKKDYVSERSGKVAYFVNMKNKETLTREVVTFEFAHDLLMFLSKDMLNHKILKGLN